MAQGLDHPSGRPDTVRELLSGTDKAERRYRGTIVAAVERRRSGQGQSADHGAARRTDSQIAEFVDALFEAGSERSRALADAALQDFGDPQKVVEALFTPAARIIGDGWRNDESDFVKVTIATSRMQQMFRRMAHERPPAVPPNASLRALLTPVPGDQHAFGLSVVEDAFRRAGWEVDCCSCDESDDMYRLAASNEYKIIGVSVSVGRLVPELAAIVGRLRARSRNASVVLMAGGSLVADDPRQVLDAGFDLAAADAASAVRLANESLPRKAGKDQLAVAAE